MIERHEACRLRDRRQVVRKPHATEVLDHRGRREAVPDPRAGERERLRKRPHDDELREAVEEWRGALAAELNVRLVDDNERGAPSGELLDELDRLRVASRVV